MENKGGKEMNVEMDAEMARLSKVIISITDILYDSDLEFEDCADVIFVLASTFSEPAFKGDGSKKEPIVKLKNDLQKEIEIFESKKVDETITDFLK